MNIDDFLLTAGLSLFTGIILGYYLNRLNTLGKRFYRRYFARPRYFDQD